MITTFIDRQDSGTSPWFASWFDSVHYHKLYAYRDGYEAASFIGSLLGGLHPAHGARMLDLGCGAGRHARQLALRGFDVTGLDLSGASIREARQFERSGLRFRQHDMREPFGAAAYDYVFNLFTSFGYFEDPAEHITVVRNMAGSLAVGGSLVLDYLNVRHAEAHLVASEIRTIDDVSYRIDRWSDEKAFFKRITIDDPRQVRPLVHVERVAKLRLADFEWMFAVAGLRLEAVYGDYCLGAYDANESPRLVMAATRVIRSRQSGMRIAAAAAPPQTLTELRTAS